MGLLTKGQCGSPDDAENLVRTCWSPLPAATAGASSSSHPASRGAAACAPSRSRPTAWHGAAISPSLQSATHALTWPLWRRRTAQPARAAASACTRSSSTQVRAGVHSLRGLGGTAVLMGGRRRQPLPRRALGGAGGGRSWSTWGAGAGPPKESHWAVRCADQWGLTRRLGLTHFWGDFGVLDGGLPKIRSTGREY